MIPSSNRRSGPPDQDQESGHPAGAGLQDARRVQAVKCPAIDGILEEAQEILGDENDPEVLDAAALASAQAVEHYEIARYGALIAWARELGRNDCARVLEQKLKEEKAADRS